MADLPIIQKTYDLINHRALRELFFSISRMGIRGE
jgi:hypothetical protein